MKSGWKIGAALLPALLVAGCQKPAPIVVYVDRSQLISPELTEQTERPLAFQPEDIRPVQAGSKEIPSVRLLLGRNQGRLEEAEKALTRNREWAYQRLMVRLSRQAEAEISRLEREQMATLEAEGERSMDSAYRDARAIFEEFADPIGSKRFRLTSLVSFPDPDPNSREPIEPDRPATAKRVQEARELRAQITELSDAYRARVNNLINGVTRANEQELKDLQAALAKQLDMLLEEADKEARKLTKGGDFQVLKDVREWDVLLEPVAAQQVAMPTPLPLAQAPQLRVATNPNGDSVKLKADLALWASENGYTLTDQPGTAPDLTRSFARWRKEWKAGHSANSPRRLAAP